MKQTDLIKEITLDHHTLRLLMEGETPVVEREGEFFHHIWHLSLQFPPLSDPASIVPFAEISNFLWKGLQFQFLDQVEDYQRFYIEQIELEQKCPTDIFQYRFTDFKIFDVSVMHPPRLEDGELFYFVYNTTNGLPYRVVCPFPYTVSSTVVHYQILPLRSGCN